MLFCGTKGPRTPNNRLQRTVRCAARRLTGALDGRLRVLPWGCRAHYTSSLTYVEQGVHRSACRGRR